MWEWEGWSERRIRSVVYTWRWQMLILMLMLLSVSVSLRSRKGGRTERDGLQIMLFNIAFLSWLMMMLLVVQFRLSSSFFGFGIFLSWLHCGQKDPTSSINHLEKKKKGGGVRETKECHTSALDTRRAEPKRSECRWSLLFHILLTQLQIWFMVSPVWTQSSFFSCSVGYGWSAWLMSQFLRNSVVSFGNLPRLRIGLILVVFPRIDPAWKREADPLFSPVVDEDG